MTCSHCIYCLLRTCFISFLFFYIFFLFFLFFFAGGLISVYSVCTVLQGLNTNTWYDPNSIITAFDVNLGVFNVLYPNSGKHLISPQKLRFSPTEGT